MIDYGEAKLLARNTVAAIAAKVCDEFVVIDEFTKEVEEGWLFFYDSKEFVETGNPSLNSRREWSHTGSSKWRSQNSPERQFLAGSDQNP